MRTQPAAAFSTINLVEVLIGQDRSKLHDLVKRCAQAGRFGVVEDIGQCLISLFSSVGVGVLRNGPDEALNIDIVRRLETGNGRTCFLGEIE